MRTYDDIVVGAGSTAAPEAARLSEDPARRVLEARADLLAAQVMRALQPVAS